MQELAQQYESEIDQVLKESAAKIDAIREQLRQQEANQRQEAAALQVRVPLAQQQQSQQSSSLSWPPGVAMKFTHIPTTPCRC